MNLLPVLRLPGLDPSQRLLLITLLSRATEVEGGEVWLAAPWREVRMLFGRSTAGMREVEADFAVLRGRRHLERAARFEAGAFRAGWYVRAAPEETKPDTAPVDSGSVRSPGSAARRGPWDEPSALAAAAAGDSSASNWIARRFFATAESFARKIGDASGESAGEGLTAAIRTFDPARGVTFSTHLHWCLRSVIRDAWRREQREPANMAGERRVLGGALGQNRSESERIEPDALEATLDVAGEIAAAQEIARLASAGPVALDLVAGHTAEETAARLGRSVHAIRRERTKVRALAKR